jgi:hypothetical protein
VVPPFDDPGVFRQTQVGIEGPADAPPPEADAPPPEADADEEPARPRVPRFDPPPPTVPEEELDAALVKLIKSKVLPAAELRAPLVHYARKKGSRHLVAEEYDAAFSCDAAIALLQETMRSEHAAHDASEQTHVLQERLAVCKLHDKELNQSKREMIERGRAGLQQLLDGLDERHEQQRGDFEARWSRPEARIPFAKPSVLLLQLRQQQKARALVHDFHAAKSLKQQAEALEKKEAAEATKRYEKAVKVAWEQLIQEQTKERQCLLENRDYEMVVQTTEKEKVIASNELTKQALERKIVEPKRAKRPIIRVPSVRPAVRPGTAGVPERAYSMLTQRTRSQFAVYRKSADMQRLDLNLPEVHDVVRPGSRKKSAG